MDKISVELAKNITQIMTEFEFETTVEILKFMDIKSIEKERCLISDTKIISNQNLPKLIIIEFDFYIIICIWSAKVVVFIR